MFRGRNREKKRTTPASKALYTRFSFKIHNSGSIHHSSFSPFLLFHSRSGEREETRPKCPLKNKKKEKGKEVGNGVKKSPDRSEGQNKNLEWLWMSYSNNAFLYRSMFICGEVAAFPVFLPDTAFADSHGTQVKKTASYRVYLMSIPFRY